ncbi:FAD-dependent oxidoreductase [uncultured Thiohalocapsa sp.]|uniref:protoporphyrinogen/coproporphyrinogen oxidase n=1 Tax=uncultured Thiohalocapsa sp. TaxID=768990 RepID=UPI0025D106F9|nr:FAD-dependent oxidoreductase [uncultured Thiohalocapsa sp.]
MSQQPSHIVIGAGISGLSAAHYAARGGQTVHVLEADARPGGCMHTHSFPALGGYWVEAGSHSCFNSYGNLLGIMEQLGILERATAKAKQSYKLWRGGRRKSIVSALHPFELLRSLPKLFGADKTGASVREYYGTGLGAKNYRDLFGPAFRSVICQPPDDFPAEALFRKKPRRKDVLRSFTMPEGLGEIPRAIAETPGVQLTTNAIATAIERDADGYAVTCADGTRHRADWLTLAVAPDVAATLLTDAAAEAAAIVAGIGMAEIDSQLLVLDKADLGVDALAGFISVDGEFLSAVSRDFLTHPQLRGFAFHFPGDRLDEQARIAAACRALDAQPERVRAAACVRNRLPALRKGHGDQVTALDRALAGGRLGLTGNWFLGVSIEDCVTRSRSEHERRFGALPETTSYTPATAASPEPR